MRRWELTLSKQASLYAPGSPSSRPRDGGSAGGARTREDTLSPQRSEDEREGGLTTEYNEFAELSRQTVEFLNPDMTTVRETLYDVVYDDDGVNGDRDALGRITKKTEWIVSGDEPNGDGSPRALDSRTYDYGYNPEGRPWLESVAVDGNVVSSYGYDDNGNRTSVESSWSQLGYDAKFDVSLGEADTEYDSADRLLAYGSKSYQWNPFGQLESMTDSDPDGDSSTNDSETTFYQYDLFGNLLRVDLPDGRAIEYDVDGAGRRVGRRELDENGDQLSFRGWIYRDLLRPIAEVDELGNVVARYVYGDASGVIRNIDEGLYARLGMGSGFEKIHGSGRLSPRYILEFASDGSVARVLAPIADDFGNVYLVADVQTGEVVQRLEYDIFGQVLADSLPGVYPFGYGGGLFDHLTRHTRFGARDVDHISGRWLARDPVKFKSGSMNLFLYAGADPLNALDATGLATYRCRRDLGDWDTTSGSTGTGPVRHDYICVEQGNHMVCNGQAAGGSMVSSPGVPSNNVDTGEGPDQFDVMRCEQVREDDACMESCVASRLESSERPRYGLPFGTDCQEWADQVLNECTLDCR